MAKAKAKARAPQTVTVDGVENGTATITVESTVDATKKDSIEVEVLEIELSTGSVNPPSRDLEIGQTVTVTSGLKPTAVELYAKGGRVVWSIVDSIESETPNTNAQVRQNGEGDTAQVTGLVKGGAVVMCKLTLDGIVMKDGSGFDVIEPKDPTIPQKIVVDDNGHTTIVTVGAETTLKVTVLPETAPQDWVISTMPDAEMCTAENQGGLLVLKGLKPGSTYATVKVADEAYNLTAGINIIVRATDDE